MTVWALGDYPRFAREMIWNFGPTLVTACGIGPDQRVLDVACGSGNVAIRAAEAGADVVACDLEPAQLEAGRDQAPEIAWVQADAAALPFADGSFDVVFSSFGALQFISDIDVAVAETARVLRPGGRFAFSITHPTRWVFPDDPGEPGLTATQSYWDRTPYVEVDDATGVVSYVEHHRTLGDWVRLLTGHGFALVDLVEPEWPEDHHRVWGGWSRLRGLLTPGTAIFAADLR